MSERLPACVTHPSARCFLSAPTCNLHTRNPCYAAHAPDTRQKNGTYPLAKKLAHRYTKHTTNQLEISSPRTKQRRRLRATSSPDSYPYLRLNVLTLSTVLKAFTFLRKRFKCVAFPVHLMRHRPVSKGKIGLTCSHRLNSKVG